MIAIELGSKVWRIGLLASAARCRSSLTIADDALHVRCARGVSGAPQPNYRPITALELVSMLNDPHAKPQKFLDGISADAEEVRFKDEFIKRLLDVHVACQKLDNGASA